MLYILTYVTPTRTSRLTGLVPLIISVALVPFKNPPGPFKNPDDNNDNASVSGIGLLRELSAKKERQTQ